MKTERNEKSTIMMKEDGKSTFKKDNRKGGKRPFKGKVTEDKPYLKGKNNIDWRTNDPVMTKLVASLPFGLAAGLTEGVTDVLQGAPLQPCEWRQPGIMVINTLIGAGNSTDYNSALNLCIRKIYSFVRHANSGSRNYEAADMGIYFVALGQLLALLGFMQRALRVAHEYSATNRYLPAKLLQTMGLDQEDIIGNYAQLKYAIAWLGRVIGGLAFPDIPYFHACYEAYKYVYRDNDSPKEQFYMLVPEELGVYNPTYDSQGGGVQYRGTATWEHGYSIQRMTVNDLLTFAKERTDVLLGDEDCGIISGDILKAFPNSSGLFKPEAFGEEYEYLLHSPEFLQQVHNCVPINPAKVNFKGYHQVPGATQQAPYIVQDFLRTTTPLGNESARLSHKLIIDAFSRVPDEKEVVNCTVLAPQSDLELDSGINAYIVNPDSIVFDLYIPTGVYIWSDINVANVTPDDVTDECSRISTPLTGTPNVTKVAKLTNFDWHPFIFHIDPGSGLLPISMIGDVQNFRIFSGDVGKRIHDNSILCLLDFKDNNFYSK